MKPVLGDLYSDADFADRSGRSASSSSSTADSQESCSEDDLLTSPGSMSSCTSSELDEDIHQLDSGQDSPHLDIAQERDTPTPTLSDEDDDTLYEGDTIAIFCTANGLMPTKGCFASGLTFAGGSSFDNHNLREVISESDSYKPNDEDNTVTIGSFHPNSVHCTQVLRRLDMTVYV